MRKKLLEKLNTQRGSATVEAVVAFTGFLLAIFTILSMVNFCRAQMRVSAAMDAAAKELSQYAYFYKMSGLQKFDSAVTGQATVGKKNINQIIGTVDTLYSTLGSTVTGTTEEITNLAEATQKGELDLQDIENVINNVEADGTNIVTSINSMTQAIEGIGNDPLLYMRSLVAIAGQQGMEMVKKAIAVPLAKLFVQKHFGSSEGEANAALESLGIEGGLNSMNFNMSSLFCDDNNEDIELVVFYKVSLFKVFDWEILEANVYKKSVCRAWLGGDDVQEYVDPTQEASLDNSNTESEDGSETEEGETGETGDTEETQPEGGVTSTGNWALEHDPTGKGYSERVMAFNEDMKNEYLLDTDGSTFSYHSDNTGETVAYHCEVYPTWTYEPYETMGGNTVSPGAEILMIPIQSGLQKIAEYSFTNAYGEIQEFGMFTQVVYVPENIPEDQYNNLVRDAEQATQELKEYIANNTIGIPENFQVEIVINKSGGEYDYNSSPSDYVNIGGQE